MTVKDMVKLRLELSKKKVEAQKSYEDALRKQITSEDPASHADDVKAAWNAFNAIQAKLFTLEQQTFEVVGEFAA